MQQAGKVCELTLVRDYNGRLHLHVVKFSEEQLVIDGFIQHCLDCITGGCREHEGSAGHRPVNVGLLLSRRSTASRSRSSEFVASGQLPAW